jgi:predicted restriction endonuclease
LEKLKGTNDTRTRKTKNEIAKAKGTKEKEKEIHGVSTRIEQFFRNMGMRRRSGVMVNDHRDQQVKDQRTHQDHQDPQSSESVLCFGVIYRQSQTRRNIPRMCEHRPL